MRRLSGGVVLRNRPQFNSSFGLCDESSMRISQPIIVVISVTWMRLSCITEYQEMQPKLQQTKEHVHESTKE
jgi:hypothetical protein